MYYGNEINSNGFFTTDVFNSDSIGSRKGTSRVKLYGELGWDSLQDRRKKHKLILMFKALQGELHNYITNNIISYINIEPKGPTI